MNDILFRNKAMDQFFEWLRKDKAVFGKLEALLKETARTPFTGAGKPEPLKGNRAGWWSRRITDEHRLVYRIENGILVIYSCMGHYED